MNKKMKSLFATALIGAIFYLGASVFLVQLAQYGWVMP